ncbi:MAG: Elongation factor P [Chlamydiia bacterium]|nr:Elongation factor P [Chlamydiia bacterium]MCH9614961.1 Elongation factor P [Chlamydiia bacterium]MCH9629989.1 Elongation factor P [Chlamydiia bacterium]
MPSVSTNEFKAGMKIEIDNDPYSIVGLEFVKPGKGQAFTRVKVKNLLTGRVIEKTYKSGEKLELADVEETKMRLLYQEGEDAVFMHDETFDQISIPLSVIGDGVKWLLEETLYDLIFYKGNAINCQPPTFLELKITETEPGIKGDTSSGRVLKPSVVETGAKVNVPIFIGEGELIKVDTRTGEYVSRVQS